MSFLNIKRMCAIVGSVAIIAFASCRKYDSLGYTPGKAAPTITSVYTAYQTLINKDSVRAIQTYDASGNLVTTYDTVGVVNHQVAIDTATTEGNYGDYYVIHGTNLGLVTDVYFNNKSAYFNRALCSDQTILVQIPTGTPYRKPLAIDSVTVVSQYGKASYHFVVLPPPPDVTTPSDYDFLAGNIDTLHGVAFDSVKAVWIQGVSTSASSKGITNSVQLVSILDDTTMVVKFPETSLTQGNLVFAYTQLNQTSGPPDTTMPTNSSVVFNNINGAYQIFIDDLQNGWGSWSWDAAGVTTDVVKSGAASFSMTFTGGGWKVDGFRNGGGTDAEGLSYSTNWQYLSFWVKGGSATETLYIQWGNAGLGQNAVNPITVQPNTWQFFKIPFSSLNWNNGSSPWSANSSSLLNTVGFFMKSNSVNEVLYFDNIMLIQ